MSLTLTLNYSDLANAATQANKISSEIDQYCSALSSKVQQKMYSVENGMSSALNSADYYVRAKIDQLRRKAEHARTLSSRIQTLRDTARRVDENVKSLIEANQKKLFSKNPELRPSNTSLTLTSIVCALKDVPIIGGLIKGAEDVADAAKTLVSNIKYWYKCEGGKEIIGVILSVVEAVVAVVLLVCAFIFTGGSILVFIAGIVSAVIAVANAFTNIYTSLEAMDAALGGHPARAKIYAGQDTLSDYLRETNFHDKFMNRASNVAAVAIEITDFVCSVISFISDVGDLVKSLGDVFKKIKTGFSDGAKKLKSFFSGNSSFNIKLHEIKTFFKNNFKDLLLGDLNVKNLSIYSYLSKKDKVKSVESFAKGFKSAFDALDKLNSGKISFSEYIGSRLTSRLEKVFLKSEVFDSRVDEKDHWKTKYYKTDFTEAFGKFRSPIKDIGLEKLISDQINGSLAKVLNLKGGFIKDVKDIIEATNKFSPPVVELDKAGIATSVTNWDSSKGYDKVIIRNKIPDIKPVVIPEINIHINISKPTFILPWLNFNFNFGCRYSYIDVAA